MSSAFNSNSPCASVVETVVVYWVHPEHSEELGASEIDRLLNSLELDGLVPKRWLELGSELDFAEKLSDELDLWLSLAVGLAKSLDLDAGAADDSLLGLWEELSLEAGSELDELLTGFLEAELEPSSELEREGLGTELDPSFLDSALDSSRTKLDSETEAE